MSVASRDDRKFAQPPMASQFVVDGTQLGFVLSDETGNITLFNYLPEAPESNGGERLTARAAINIGTNVNTFLRLKGDQAIEQPNLASNLSRSYRFDRFINRR